LKDKEIIKSLLVLPSLDFLRSILEKIYQPPKINKADSLEANPKYSRIDGNSLEFFEIHEIEYIPDSFMFNPFFFFEIKTKHITPWLIIISAIDEYFLIVIINSKAITSFEQNITISFWTMQLGILFFVRKKYFG